MEIVTAVISFLYAATGIVAILGYIPTIRDLIKNNRGANFHSYVVWTLCSVISFLYALIVISDLLLEIVTGLNLAACAIIMILTLRIKPKRKK